MIRWEEFYPQGTYVLIKSEPRRNQKGAIHLPEAIATAERLDFTVGRILRLGLKCEENSVPLKEGDRVIYRSYTRDIYGFCFSPIETPTHSLHVSAVNALDSILAVVGEDVDVGVFSEVGHGPQKS